MLKTKTKNQKFNATSIVCATALALCLYAPRAEAFGGLGILGHKSSHKGGVNAIGVHIDANNTQQPDIDIRSCDSETEELVGTECLPKCPENLERNTDGSCTVCANKNVYLSYMDDPCGTDTPMNQVSCDIFGGCPCCNDNTNLCMAVLYKELGAVEICPENTATSCKSNKDCDQGEFCNLNHIAPESVLDTGTCTSLGNSTEYTWNNSKFLLSEINLSWWSAENWCKAQGKQMVKLVDFNIDATNLPKYTDYYNCNGSDCTGVDWSSLLQLPNEKAWWLFDGTDNTNAQIMYVSPDIESSFFMFDLHGLMADYYALCK